jgi:hypothetical protein
MFCAGVIFQIIVRSWCFKPALLKKYFAFFFGRRICCLIRMRRRAGATNTRDGNSLETLVVFVMVTDVKRCQGGLHKRRLML